MSGTTSASDLGLDLDRATPQQLYRWFLVCLLFGRPIQQELAIGAWHSLLDAGFTSPKKFDGASRERLRKVLDDGGYGRFDYLMSDELHAVMSAVVDRYDSVNRLVRTASSRHDLESRLQEFDGVGPTTARIFLRDLPERLIGG